MLISEAFAEYESDVIAFRGQSSKTTENHYVCMRALLNFAADIEVEKLTFITIRNWKQYLEKTRSPATIRNYIIRLRVVLDFLNKRGYQVVSTDQIPVPKRVDKVPAFITKEDVAQLIDSSVRLRSKAIISLLYSSGIRVNELCNLNSADLHHDSFTILGKGGKARLCFIDERTRSLIAAYLTTRDDSSPSLFISQTGARLSATNVQLLVKISAKNAGMTKHITPHTLRHTFATELLLENTNLRHVQVLLGHADISTTQMYTHVVDRDLEKVYREKHTV